MSRINNSGFFGINRPDIYDPNSFWNRLKEFIIGTPKLICSECSWKEVRFEKLYRKNIHKPWLCKRHYKSTLELVFDKLTEKATEDRNNSKPPLVQGPPRKYNYDKNLDPEYLYYKGLCDVAYANFLKEKKERTLKRLNKLDEDRKNKNGSSVP
jgi:hypothetical protein